MVCTVSLEESALRRCQTKLFWEIPAKFVFQSQGCWHVSIGHGEMTWHGDADYMELASCGRDTFQG